jgi:hypothetical protein
LSELTWTSEEYWSGWTSTEPTRIQSQASWSSYKKTPRASARITDTARQIEHKPEVGQNLLLYLQELVSDGSSTISWISTTTNENCLSILIGWKSTERKKIIFTGIWLANNENTEMDLIGLPIRPMIGKYYLFIYLILVHCQVIDWLP